MLARKAAARTRRAERRKRWTIWDGIAQWGAPTLGRLAFMMTTGFLLLGAGGIVAGGVGALVGLGLWLTLLVGIAAPGGPQQHWRRFRPTPRIPAEPPAVSRAMSRARPPYPISTPSPSHPP